MAAMASVGYRHVHLDAASQTVWFDRPGVELDPGGIGKGYAVDRMVDVLKRQGRDHRAGGRRPAAASTAWARRPDEPRGWRDRSSAIPWTASKTRGRGLSEERCRCPPPGSYEKFFRRRRPHLQPTSWTRARAIRRRACCRFRSSRRAPSTARRGPSRIFINGRQWAAQHKPQGFRVSFAKTGRISHARGSNDQPLFGRLPAPAHRRSAGMVHAAGGPLHEAVPRDPRASTASWRSASGPTWPPPSPCSRWKFWTWMPPSFSPTCCCPSSRWA